MRRALGGSGTAIAVCGTALLAGLLVVSVCAVGLVLRAIPSALQSSDSADGVSPSARDGIPAQYLQLYQAAARRYGIDWSILAGIGEVECDHGRDPDPSCTREGAVNGAGAGGPMQFLASTWSTYGVDGNGDGRKDRWDPADAIYAAANYLRASGAQGDYGRAIYAYNHADWYVAEVERWAATYRGLPSAGGEPAPPDGAGSSFGPQRPPANPLLAPGASTTRLGQPALPIETPWGAPVPAELISGPLATLAPGDGHVALIPDQAPPAVQAMLLAGDELQNAPYGPAGHPDPRGAASQDCSSAVNYVLYRAGVRSIEEIVRDNPTAQTYAGWGASGPGRWVTIYATAGPTDHVFIVIAGLRLDTSHRGTDIGPNRLQDGPRWRIFPIIPTWARWSVRHPPGL